MRVGGRHWDSVVTVMGWALWAVLIRLVARTAFQLTAALDVTIRLVALASAPFVFGCLILTPYPPQAPALTSARSGFGNGTMLRLAAAEPVSDPFGAW
jgi:hypothetical protein